MRSAADQVVDVREYYGRVLQTARDLKTGACCATDSVPAHIQRILQDVHPEVLARFYGCGSPIPAAIDGRVVLDLGCGTGRDAYVVSMLVGERGRVIGVDMTDAQLEVARRHVAHHAEKFGFREPNVDFRAGYIEDLREAGIDDDSVDVVTSNCAINLSPDKEAVFSEIFRVLKPGGELLFADVFAERRVPEHLKTDPVLLGECLAGAIYIEDFRRLLRRMGCLDYRVLARTRSAIDNPEVGAKVGMIGFCSMTVRAFKLDTIEDICEDYGQVATYLGTLPHHPNRFVLDDHHIFETGKPMLVCGNTASMVGETRYGEHFKVTGDRANHYGPFPCGPATGPTDDPDCCVSGSCCA